MFTTLSIRLIKKERISRTSFDLHMGTHQPKSDKSNPVPGKKNRMRDPLICELCGETYPEISGIEET